MAWEVVLNEPTRLVLKRIWHDRPAEFVLAMLSEETERYTICFAARLDAESRETSSLRLTLLRCPSLSLVWASVDYASDDGGAPALDKFYQKKALEISSIMIDSLPFGVAAHNLKWLKDVYHLLIH